MATVIFYICAVAVISDAHGNVWSAHWGGSCLIRYDRQGNETLRIPFPVRRVSSVTFGGDDYSDIYVTTANSVMSEGANKAEEGEHAGALFRLMTEEQKSLLVSNIAGAMAGVSSDVVDRQLQHFYKADPAYGEAIAKLLNVQLNEV